jgi:hypothetical protein
MRHFETILVLDQISDIRNFVAIIRTAECTDSIDEYLRLLVREDLKI